MALAKAREVYAIIVHITDGSSLEGYVERGGDTEGLWFLISRTPDLNSATYINRDKVTYFELAEIK